jgi:hypothetical protein
MSWKCKFVLSWILNLCGILVRELVVSEATSSSDSNTESESNDMEGKVGVGPNKRRKFHGKKAMVITEETI